MEKIIKYMFIALIFVSLLIPIFFGIYIEFLFVRELSPVVIFVLLFGLLMLLLIGKLIGIYGYNPESIEKMKKHDVIDAFINNHKLRLWIFFLIIMIIEELILRYYLIGFLFNQIKLDIISIVLISGIIFSLYHIHTWFSFKNLRILLINLGYSFLLGLLNGYILLTLGIVPCIIIHYAVAILLYYAIYKRNYKTNN